MQLNCLWRNSRFNNHKTIMRVQVIILSRESASHQLQTTISMADSSSIKPKIRTISSTDLKVLTQNKDIAISKAHNLRMLRRGICLPLCMGLQVYRVVNRRISRRSRVTRRCFRWRATTPSRWSRLTPRCRGRRPMASSPKSARPWTMCPPSTSSPSASTTSGSFATQTKWPPGKRGPSL